MSADQFGNILAEIFGATGHFLEVRRARGSLGSEAIVEEDDVLHEIVVKGHDGTEYVQAGRLAFEVEGTPGTGDVESRLVVDAEQLRVLGQLVAGSGAHVLTTAAGLIDGTKMQSGTVGFAALNTTEFNQNITSSTITNVANIASTSGASHFWNRSGKDVRMSGRITISATAANTLTQVRIALPFLPDTVSNNRLSGTGTAPNGNNPVVAASINSGISDTTALFTCAPPTTAALTYTYNIQYRTP